MRLRLAGCSCLVAAWFSFAGHAASGREIYIPTPKGEDAVLDSPQPAEPEAGADTLRFGKASQVAGKLAGISPDGLITLNSPDLKGNLEVLLASARMLTFGRKVETRKDAKLDRMALTNGDLLCGDVVTIAPETVTFSEPAIGTVSIARRVVRSIAFGSGSFMVLETNFSEGAKGWQPRQGTWAVRNGKYWSSHGTSLAWAEADQEGPLTCEWAMESQQRYAYAGVVLMASSNAEYWGRDAIGLQVAGNSINCYVVSNRDTREIGSYQHNSTISGAEFRLSYDPDKGSVRVWMNNAEIGNWTSGETPKSGKYVMLVSQQPTGFRYIRIARGAGAPPRSDGGPDSETDRLLLNNKDRVSGEVLALDQGTLKLKTPYGAMDIGVDRIGEITFRKSGLETPRRRARDIQVEFNESRLTFEIGQLGEASLEGKTEFAGDVTVRREALKSIRFNLYE